MMLRNLLEGAGLVSSRRARTEDLVVPITHDGVRVLVERGGEATIAWLRRAERDLEKLATPDVTIADLIGEIDLIKHAEGKHLANEDVMHVGLIPRSHRGIFCMNELPDLAPKIQVGLFNVREERDVPRRGLPRGRSDHAAKPRPRTERSRSALCPSAERTIRPYRSDDDQASTERRRRRTTFSSPIDRTQTANGRQTGFLSRPHQSFGSCPRTRRR